ncbi:putative quinol monooxygenase [Marinobacterium arenosum]|uniref:putative quinol monooxygenase n=1 Tax=Marinobacterium arenosum TaxID=2862496 RepID=UPI001C98DCFC|nr:putative quinol monooxygenase [Marinobacterium arenosum]MBY4677294.1 antibiotic biosynthesis monooxygenase [Marinobacterium arenosum]
MSVLTCIAKIQAKAGAEEQVKQALSKLLEPTRQEEGCLNYDLHVDNEDPTIFMFHENWQSEAMLDQHLESKHIKECFELIGGLLASVEINRLSKIG